MHRLSSRLPLAKLITAAAVLSVTVSVPARAAPIANCNANLTQCSIPENVLLQLPLLAVSGDVVLTESNGTTVSDVFRIFNNLADTGQGTGLGDLAEMFSADDVAVPPPSSYSANVVFILESPSGITPYLGSGGTTYVLGVPEPQSLALLPLAAAVIFVFGRRRVSKSGGMRP